MNIFNPINTAVQKLPSQNIMWKKVSGYGKTCQIVDSFKLKNNILGDLFLVRDGSFSNSFDWHKFMVLNRCGKELGYETLKISPDEKYITGGDIYVIDEYRKRFRLGEILRLSSVIELLENNMDSIKITSKNTAVYFHSKYGFVPDFKGFDVTQKVLNDMIQNGSSNFLDITKKAKELLEKARDKTPAVQRDVCKDTNALLTGYLSRALKSDVPEKTHPISSYIEMILTKEKVLEKKNFFNDRFSAHSIDYRIE